MHPDWDLRGTKQASPRLFDAEIQYKLPPFVPNNTSWLPLDAENNFIRTRDNSIR